MSAPVSVFFPNLVVVVGAKYACCALRRLGFDALPAGTAEAVPAVPLALAPAGCAVGETVALLVGADVG